MRLVQETQQYVVVQLIAGDCFHFVCGLGEAYSHPQGSCCARVDWPVVI